MKQITIGSATAKPGAIVKGQLKTGDFPDGRPVEIPVVIAQGTGDGPTLWLHGCVHGNEYCGTFIIHELLRTLDPAQLAGTVVALPILNINAFRRMQRMSPFEGYGGGDLNRCFPGDPNGSLTQQMAHAIYANLKQHADALVDFHTAMTPDVRWALYADAPGDVGKQSEGIARAFGYNSTLPAPMDILAGSAMMTAAKDGIPAYIVEAGGKGAGFDRATVEDGCERLRNVMRHLGMLHGAVTDHGPLTYFSNFAWVMSTRGGLFQRAVRCGDRLQEGTVLGQYYDLYGNPDGEAISPHAGVVLAIHAGPLMANGETLVHIGLDPRSV
ncbi:MAG: succinylglutamate desuccinylase/aspartoacylase family protein [Hyphomicrobiales bacterium]|nr:succinylglutamate desuccinylase/aspartoacylase family protein [Hyphomicrobiales bacterium]MCP5374184.1 succinylglutamate desuccinylase/aspartoacylase family protein [Hyphomicrobiales bacterium]